MGWVNRLKRQPVPIDGQLTVDDVLDLQAAHQHDVNRHYELDECEGVTEAQWGDGEVRHTECSCGCVISSQVMRVQYIYVDED